jgi:hypothetical protein
MNLVDDFNHDLAYFSFIFSKHTLAIDSTHLIKILLDGLHEKGDVRPGGKCTAIERRNYYVKHIMSESFTCKRSSYRAAQLLIMSISEEVDRCHKAAVIPVCKSKTNPIRSPCLLSFFVSFFHFIYHAFFPTNVSARRIIYCLSMKRVKATGRNLELDWGSIRRKMNGVMHDDRISIKPNTKIKNKEQNNK